jgi:hypothetical protein
MKTFLCIALIILVSLPIRSQNNFKLALKCSEAGNYAMADSFLDLHLKEFPKDKNARYNHGVLRLNLGDTCSFCTQMHLICDAYQDKNACEFVKNLCASYDTAYFDNGYAKCEKKKARYTEITEGFKYNDYKTVFIHDKKNKGGTTFFNPDLNDNFEVQKTDIFAVYKLSQDSSRVFLFSQTPPSFPGGDDAWIEYYEKNQYFIDAMKDLNLKKVIAKIEILVDKFGYLRKAELVEIDSNVDQPLEIKKLEPYVLKIMLGMPKYTPAKFLNENVAYLTETMICFW